MYELLFVNHIAELTAYVELFEVAYSNFTKNAVLFSNFCCMNLPEK